MTADQDSAAELDEAPATLPDTLPDTLAEEPTADEVPEDGPAAWAEAARPRLLEVAGRYQAVIAFKELGEQVQADTGIEATRLLHHWISDVLLRVARDCAERGEPNLGSLCVNSSGSVGNGYKSAHATLTGEQLDDPDDHAARERLACYRHFGAENLPVGGGVRSLTPQVAASRTRARKAAAEARPIPTCPHCNMAFPSTGICDNCG